MNSCLKGTPTRMDLVRGLVLLTVCLCLASARASSTAEANAPLGAEAGARDTIAPVLTSSLTATGAVNALFSYTIVASGSDPISFSAAPLPNGITLSGCTLSGTPTDAGSTNVTLGATNSAGGDSKTLTLTINPAGAPAVTSALAVTGNVGTPFTYQITASGNTPITFTATNLPAGLSFAGDTISGTPTGTGKTNVAISAANSLGTDTKTLAVTINAAGAPAITSPLSATGQADQAFSYTITASGAGPITYSVSGQPGWLTLTGAVLSGTPDTAGNYSVQLTVANASGSDTQTLRSTIAPANSNPPSVTDISISRNPVRTYTDVTFSVQAVSLSGLPLSYSWYFFLNQVGDGPALAGQTVTRQFAVEGEYDAVVLASDGYSTSARFRKVTITLAPNPGGEGKNITDGKPALVNPESGLGIQVTDSLAGVLNVDVVAGAPRADETYETNFSNGRAPVRGLFIAGKFQQSLIYVVTTMAQLNGTPTRKMRRMIPVARRETGETLGTSAETMVQVIRQPKLKGKCTFGLRRDGLTMTGVVELPVGMDISQPMDVPVGIGNLVDTVRLSNRGKMISGDKGLVTKMRVKFPRRRRGVTMTRAGDKASLSITISGSRLHDAGLDTEGITNNQNLKAKQKYLRTIQTAIIFWGVPYETLVQVDYAYSEKTGGAFMSRRGQ